MSIATLAVKRPVTIAMVTLAVILFGFVALGRIPVTLLPDLAYPSLTVRTDYPGGAPSEVEQLISKPIEENLGTVKGIRRIESISRAGQSDVVLQFSWGTDMDMASLDVREKLDLVALPLDVDKPVLLRFNPSEEPVMRLALGFDSVNSASSMSELKQLRTFAEEDLKRQLEAVEGVASVRLGGGLEDEIQVNVDMQRAGALKIPMALIIDRLRAENVNLSAGRLETSQAEYLVRTVNQFESLDDIRSIYIASRDGQRILLGDIALIENSAKERDSISRVKGIEAVEISLYKEGDANTVEVAQAVQAHLNHLTRAELIPTRYQVTTIYNQAEFIKAAIAEVRDAAIIGGLLAMLVIYFFLQRLWPTIIISIAIPISIIATFNLMHGYQVSLNMMSLGGIALAVGMLVDNAIVVLENIARRAEQEEIEVAAEKGTQEVTSAIIASTLTTMAVFFPLVFVEGLAGQLFRDQALTVTFSLAASLLVALTLIPMLSSRAKSNAADDPRFAAPARMRPQTKWQWVKYSLAFPLRLVFRYIPLLVVTLATFVWRLCARVMGLIFKPLLATFNLIYTRLAAAYATLLELALKRAQITLGLILITATACYALLPQLPVSLLPTMQQGEFYLEVELAPGTTIEQTDGLLKRLDQALQAEPEIASQIARVSSIAGTGSLLNAAPGQTGNQWGRLNVVLAAGVTDPTVVQDVLRKALTQEPGVSSKFGQPELFSFSAPVTIELVGYELASLQQSAEQVATQLAQYDRFSDIRVNMTDGQPELAVIFDHPRLAQYGLTSAQVSELLATKVGGRVATQYSLADRKIDVLVRSQISERNSIRDIEQTIINPGADREVPLAAVATVMPMVGPSEITRVDQQRTAIVSANLAYGDLGRAIEQAQQVLDQTQLPLTVKAMIAGQNEELEQSFNSLQFALILAVFMVYLVMASQFESLLHPLFILGAVPLAGAGSILGLYLTGTELSVIVFIGLIMLAGIVVNNAIVLVDRINQLRTDGLDRYDAIKQAAQQRLRPILMTMLTTVLGLMPLALGLGEGAEIRAPMAISVIAGLLFSTLLTLLFIPALYLLVDRKQVATAEQAS